MEPSATVDTQNTTLVSEHPTIQINSEQQSMYPTDGIQMENYVTSMEDNDQHADEAAGKEQEHVSQEESKHE